jgi:hypothetical protein
MPPYRRLWGTDHECRHAHGIHFGSTVAPVHSTCNSAFSAKTLKIDPYIQSGMLCQLKFDKKKVNHARKYSKSSSFFSLHEFGPCDSEESRASARGFFKEKAILNFMLSILKHIVLFLPVLTSGASAVRAESLFQPNSSFFT